MATPPLDRGPIAKQPPRARPDARPMRLALGAGGLAAMSALAATIVAPPRASPPSALDYAQATADPHDSAVNVQQPIRYVQLQPGQTAPPGATVIDPAAPTPMTVVVTITPPPQPAPPAPIIRTTQSGKRIP